MRDCRRKTAGRVARIIVVDCVRGTVDYDFTIKISYSGRVYEYKSRTIRELHIIIVL